MNIPLKRAVYVGLISLGLLLSSGAVSSKDSGKETKRLEHRVIAQEKKDKKSETKEPKAKNQQQQGPKKIDFLENRKDIPKYNEANNFLRQDYRSTQKENIGFLGNNRVAVDNTRGNYRSGPRDNQIQERGRIIIREDDRNRDNGREQGRNRERGRERNRTFTYRPHRENFDFSFFFGERERHRHRPRVETRYIPYFIFQPARETIVNPFYFDHGIMNLNMDVGKNNDSKINLFYDDKTRYNYQDYDDIWIEHQTFEPPVWGWMDKKPIFSKNNYYRSNDSTLLEDRITIHLRNGETLTINIYNKN